MASTANHASAQPPPPGAPGDAGLRRDVTVWGSYMWGFADVGADTFVALGLVFAITQGAAPLAFALAGLVYILIGLAYTELASAYPVAGGGQYYAQRGLGDFWGLISGSALLLDYTIDIALFSYFCSTYMDHFFPRFALWRVPIGPFPDVHLGLMLQTLAVIGALMWLNIRGMREASLLNEVIGVLIILTECAIIIMGFMLVWHPQLVSQQWTAAWTHFETKRFLYGSSLAIISFVGLESISQAAQETRRPATIVPRTSLGLIFTVFLFAVAISTLTLGVVHWQVFEDPQNVGQSVALIASHLPWIGAFAQAFTAALASLVLLISANSGVMSVSRLTFSMSKFEFISSWFEKVHPVRGTPVRTIVIFSGIGALEVVLASLTRNAIDTLANMYAFGATLGYTLVLISLVRLRFIDPYTPRPYKVPFNVRVKSKRGLIDFPVLGCIGTLSITAVFLIVLVTHSVARVTGPAWVLLCFLYYAWYRRKRNLPVFGTVARDWEGEQKEVLASAEEYDLLEQYKVALSNRDRQLKREREKASGSAPA
jgi:basic amino acid/polyamine antiporter, APA family